MNLVEAIRAFCQADATIKVSVGGNRDTGTPYTEWNSEEYTFPYATMTDQSGKNLMYIFGGRGSEYIEPREIQFTFWDVGDRAGEARLRTALDYFVQKINGEILSLTNTTNMAITLKRPHTVKFFRKDGVNNLNAPCWQGVAVFEFLQQRKVGTVE